MWEICSRSAIKALEGRSGVFIVNLEQILYINLLFTSLVLKDLFIYFHFIYSWLKITHLHKKNLCIASAVIT